MEVDSRNQLLQVRLAAEVEGLVLLAKNAKAPVGADQGTGVRMGVVVKLGWRLAVNGADDQVRRPRVPGLDPYILRQEADAGVKPAALGKEHRDHSEIRPARGVFPDLTVDCGVDLALLPRPEAVRANHHGNRAAVGEAAFQGRRPVVTRTQIPVVLERFEAPVAERLRQSLDLRIVPTIVAEKNVDKLGHMRRPRAPLEASSASVAYNLPTGYVTTRFIAPPRRRT